MKGLKSVHIRTVIYMMDSSVRNNTNDMNKEMHCCWGENVSYLMASAYHILLSSSIYEDGGLQHYPSACLILSRLDMKTF